MVGGAAFAPAKVLMTTHALKTTTEKRNARPTLGSLLTCGYRLGIALGQFDGPARNSFGGSLRPEKGKAGRLAKQPLQPGRGLPCGPRHRYVLLLRLSAS